MAEVLLSTLADALGGPVVADATFTATATRARAVGDGVVANKTITVSLTAGVPSEQILLDQSGVDWCWRLRVVFPSIGVRIDRTVAVPDVVSVEWADLVDVDPATLLPDAGAVPAWTAAVGQVAGLLADTVVARDAATTAQGLSEDARDAAVLARGIAEGARDGAVVAKGASEAARDQAQVYAANTVELQDTTFTALIADEDSATRTQLNATYASKSDTDTALSGKAPASVIGSRYSTPIPPPKGLKLVTAFKSGHGFIKTGGGTADLNKAVESPLAPQCVEIVTDGAGGGSIITNASVPPVNLGNGRVAILVYASSAININGIQAYLGSSSAAYRIYTSFGVQLTAGEPSNSNYTALQPGKWQWLYVTPSNVNSTVGTPDMSAVTWWRLRVADNSLGPNTIRFGGFGHFPIESRFSGGVVCFGFDDGFVGQRTIAAPMLAEKGWAATAYPIVSLIGSGPGYMTLEQIRELQDTYRWSIGGHAADNALHSNGGYTRPGVTLQQAADDMLANQIWLMDNHFRHTGLFAWPGGGVSADLMELAATYYSSARSSGELPLATPIPDVPLNVRSVGLTAANPASYYTDLIDKAQANGNLLDLRGHGVVEGTATGISVSRDTLQAIVDHCATVGIEVSSRDRVNAALQTLV